jgi:hypothetical protein
MDVAEILNNTNEVLDYVPFEEGNLPTGHQYAQRTGIPDPTWRSWYQGVQPVKGTAAKVTDSCGMMRNYSFVDKELADLNGNTSKFRANQDRPIMQGMSHSFASNFFYGDESVTPERFTGLTPRFSTVLTSGAQSAQNVIDAGGTGSTNTSVWILNMSPTTLFGFYPKGSKAGLTMQDQGEFTMQNAPVAAPGAPAGGLANGFMQAYKTYYSWDVGIAVPDWRHAVRICNVDVALLVKDVATGGDLIDLLTQGVEQIQALDGSPVICMNRKVRQFLRRQMVAKIKSSTLTWEMVGGKRVMMFDEVPIARVDALLNTESRVQ